MDCQVYNAHTVRYIIFQTSILFCVSGFRKRSLGYFDWINFRRFRADHSVFMSHTCVLWWVLFSNLKINFLDVFHKWITWVERLGRFQLTSGLCYSSTFFSRSTGPVSQSCGLVSQSTWLGRSLNLNWMWNCKEGWLVCSVPRVIPVVYISVESNRCKVHVHIWNIRLRSFCYSIRVFTIYMIFIVDSLLMKFFHLSKYYFPWKCSC